MSVSEADLAAYARSTFGQRGSKLAARAFSMADGRSQSRPESELRVRLVSAGLPKPVVQLAIVLPNGVTLHPDLAWEEYRVAAEYDGLWHGDADQFHRDRRRLNLLVASGWLVLHVTSQRMRHRLPGRGQGDPGGAGVAGLAAKIALTSRKSPVPSIVRAATSGKSPVPRWAAHRAGGNFREVARAAMGRASCGRQLPGSRPCRDGPRIVRAGNFREVARFAMRPAHRAGGELSGSRPCRDGAERATSRKSRRSRGGSPGETGDQGRRSARSSLRILRSSASVTCAAGSSAAAT